MTDVIGNITSNPSPAQIARRKFDHDEARARHAGGQSINAIAISYGVSWAAVARVVSPKWRSNMHAATARHIARRRVPCLGGCGRLVWTHGSRDRTGFCRQCLAAKRRDDAPHGTENKYGHGCHCEKCTAASSAARRAARERMTEEDRQRVRERDNERKRAKKHRDVRAEVSA
jgi:hypothetical protein